MQFREESLIRASAALGNICQALAEIRGKLLIAQLLIIGIERVFFGGFAGAIGEDDLDCSVLVVALHPLARALRL